MRKRSLAAPSSILPADEGAAPISTSEPQAYVNAIWLGSKVALLWRDEHGELRKREVSAEHCAHLRIEDWPALEGEVRRSKAIKGYKVERDWVRLTFIDRDACRQLCGPGGWFELKGVQTYEADLHPVRRYFAEHPDIQIQRPRRGYVDIETDPRVPFERQAEEARILIIGLQLPDGSFWQGVLDEDTDRAEVELLAQFWERLAACDQVAAWAGSAQEFSKRNQDGIGIFDFDVLFARTKRYSSELRVVIGRWLWISHLEVYAKINMSTSSSGEEKQSMSLHSVATSLGLVGKDDFDITTLWDAWEKNGEELDRACRYNERDVRLMPEIEAKKPYLDLITSVCMSCGVFPDHRGMNGTSYVECFLLRLAARRGMHFRSHWGYSKGSKFEGAFVLEPTRLGVLRDVHVCDFASLYPSIIQTWNLSPETHAPEHKQFKLEHARPSYLAHEPIKEQPLPPGHARAPNTGEVFRTDVIGLLPDAVTELRRLRSYYSKLREQYPVGSQEHEDAKHLSDGYKICVNTFYGVVGSVFSRFFMREVAESTSTTGAWLIKHVMREVEARGWKVISGDTDSAFVQGPTQQQFQDFVTWLNEVRLPELVRGQGCVKNEIKLEAEKGFDVLVYVAKKNYAGRFAYYKGKPAKPGAEPEVKGLEYKRGDTVRLARAAQKEVIDRLLVQDQHPAPADLGYTAANFREVAERWQAHVTKGEIEQSDYVVSKSLGQSLGGYVAVKKKDGTDGALPAHVEVAKRMKAQGMRVTAGTRIEYVVVDGSASPQKTVGLWEFTPGMEDRHHIWENQVYPAMRRVLEVCFPEFDWKLYARSRPFRGRGAKHGGVGDGQLGIRGVTDDVPAASRRA